MKQKKKMLKIWLIRYPSVVYSLSVQVFQPFESANFFIHQDDAAENFLQLDKHIYEITLCLPSSKAISEDVSLSEKKIFFFTYDESGALEYFFLSIELMRNNGNGDER